MLNSQAMNCLDLILRTPSVNGTEGEATLAVVIADYLAEAGIEARVEAVNEGRANVVALIRGADESCTNLWNGHLDTVPFGALSAWHTDPAIPVFDETHVTCRGSSDMKGGLAAMITALSEMALRGLKPAQNILFVATCDEEKGGMGAGHFIQNHGDVTFKHMVIAEPTHCRLGISQKGCLWLSITVNGKTSHGAYPEKGVNAIEGAEAIYAFLKYAYERDEDELLGHSTVTLTKLSGGIAYNMVPDQCDMTLDIRLTPYFESRRLLNDLEVYINGEWAERFDAAEATITVINDREALHVPTTSLFYEKLKQLMDTAETPMGVRYFTDASVLSKYFKNIPVILYGPGYPEMAHQPNEKLSLKAYAKAVDFYEALYVTAL